MVLFYFLFFCSGFILERVLYIREQVNLMSIVFVVFLLDSCTRGSLVIYQVQIMKRKVSKQK